MSFINIRQAVRDTFIFFLVCILVPMIKMRPQFSSAWCTRREAFILGCSRLRGERARCVSFVFSAHLFGCWMHGGTHFCSLFHSLRGSGAHFTHDRRCRVEFHYCCFPALFTMRRTAVYDIRAINATQTNTNIYMHICIILSSTLIYPGLLSYCINIWLEIYNNMQ